MAPVGALEATKIVVVEVTVAVLVTVLVEPVVVVVIAPLVAVTLVVARMVEVVVTGVACREQAELMTSAEKPERPAGAAGVTARRRIRAAAGSGSTMMSTKVPLSNVSPWTSSVGSSSRRSRADSSLEWSCEHSSAVCSGRSME